MAISIAFIALLAALTAPIHVRIDVLWQEGFEMDMWLRVWGLPFGQSLRIGDRSGPKGIFMLPEGDGDSPATALRKRLADIGSVLRGKWARRYLQRHVQVKQLDACIRICLSDAARTALMTGAARSLAQTVMRRGKRIARIAVFPDFIAGRSSMEARCILRFRLGHMIPVCIAALASWLMERREHRVLRVSKEV